MRFAPAVISALVVAAPVLAAPVPEPSKAGRIFGGIAKAGWGIAKSFLGFRKRDLDNTALFERDLGADVWVYKRSPEFTYRNFEDSGLVERDYEERDYEELDLLD